MKGHFHRFYFIPLCIFMAIIIFIDPKMPLCSNLKSKFLLDNHADIKLPFDWQQNTEILDKLSDDALLMTKNLSDEALYFLVENLVAESRWVRKTCTA